MVISLDECEECEATETKARFPFIVGYHQAAEEARIRHPGRARLISQPLFKKFTLLQSEFLKGLNVILEYFPDDRESSLKQESIIAMMSIKSLIGDGPAGHPNVRLTRHQQPFFEMLHLLFMCP